MNREQIAARLIKDIPYEIPLHAPVVIDTIAVIVREALAAQPVAVPEGCEASVAAIQFALTQGLECEQFLRLWNEGEFDIIRQDWPECFDEVFIGADPLFAAAPKPEQQEAPGLTDEELLEAYCHLHLVSIAGIRAVIAADRAKRVKP